MKPLKLKMYGIGPYANSVEVDFNKLNEEGLFLITGATGAGKTSIFDGITYALYGETNFKDDDKTNGIICDYLEVKDHKNAYVEFVFEIDNTEYTIKRMPAYQKYKKNKEKKKTKEGEKLEINSNPSKKIPENKKDMDKYIEQEILKVDVSQFKKLIMLPQGAFSEFIRSKSSSKKETLEKIFDTDIYRSITDKLREKVKELTGGKNEIKNNIFAKLETLNIDEKRWNELLNEKLLAFEELDQMMEIKKHKLEEEIKEIKEEIKKIDLDKIIADITNGKNLNNSIEKLKKAKENIKILNKEYISIEGKKEDLKIFKLAKDINIEYTKKESSLASYEKKEKEYKVAVEELERYKKENNLKIEGLEKLTKELELLKEKVSILDLLKEDVKKYNELLKKIENNKVKLKKLVEEDLPQKEGLEKKELLKKEDLKLKRVKISEDIDIAVKLNLEKEKCKNKNTILKDIVEKYEKLLEEEKKLEDKNKKLSELILERKERLDIYEKQNNLWFQSEAYNLVGKLEEKKPCPVCGSLDHPDKAKKPEGVPTEKELKKYEENYKKIRKVEDTLSGEIEISEKNIVRDRSELEERLKEENYDNNYGSLVELKKKNVEREKEIDTKLKTLFTVEELKKLEKEEASNIVIIDKIKEEKINLEKNIGETENKLRYQTEESNSLKEKLEENNITISDFEENYKKILEDKDIKELEEEKIKKLREDRGNIESTLQEKLENLRELKIIMEEAQVIFEEKFKEKNFSDESEYIVADKIKGKEIEVEIKEYNDNLIRVEAIIEEKKDYEGLEVIDVLVLEDKKQVVEKTIQSLNTEISIRIAEVSQVDTKQIELKAVEKKIEKKEKISNIYSKLLKISEGKYGDKKNNITFQNYVLGVYFEEVLDRANERFTKMTNNQYQMILHRKEKTSKGEAGLDINVSDSHTGKERSIKTLSGGETFKASMALALGLSDVVQSQNGGIQLDSVFIDEGFGTLDEESLSAAMDILMDLKSSGRTVGIISHVNELKQTITSQIRVTKTNRGSKLEVVI